MKIGYLGAGAWGFCLANLLAGKGYQVKLWDINGELLSILQKGNEHPKLRGFKPHPNITVIFDFEEAIQDVDMIVESVTSQGFRPVFEKFHSLGGLKCPITITSKGIEQNSGLLLSEVAIEVLGEEARPLVGCISGPSLALEVIRKLPASVVSSSYDGNLMHQIREAFTTPYFRVYPNSDMAGVSFGGAMKNTIAIASGIADGLGFGENTKAALMTRGLHEIRKLSKTKGCRPETLNGLSGLGDLCVTCLSTKSRNYGFGYYLAQGMSPDEAKEKIGMVVEGSYTCLSALQLSRKSNIPIPITEGVHDVVYGGLKPKDVVESLLTREVKEEHL